LDAIGIRRESRAEIGRISQTGEFVYVLNRLGIVLQLKIRLVVQRECVLVERGVWKFRGEVIEQFDPGLGVLLRIRGLEGVVLRNGVRSFRLVLLQAPSRDWSRSDTKQ